MQGILYGVGVGPGDPELLTIKAVNTIGKCDMIAVPGKKKESSVAYQIAKQGIQGLEDKPCLELEMPMTKNPEILEKAHIDAAKMIMQQLDEGKNIAFLTLGDPTIYSTYIYVHKIVKREGYSTEIISGIPSFCAVASKAGMSLVEQNEMLHIIPSIYETDRSMQLPGTKVFMKVGNVLDKLKKNLEPTSQVVMIENCGMESEHIYTEVDKIPEQAGYYSILVLKE